MMPIKNKKKVNKLSTNILNYFAAFTETRFNFRTLINYRWTNNELTLDLSIFQDFQDTLSKKIKAGDRTPISVRSNEHILTLSGDEILPEINKALSNKFGAEYLDTCIEQEHQKIAERNMVLVDTETGTPPADKPILSEGDVDRQNKQAFYDGRQIELESYGYRFLRLNKFNLRPGQKGETKTDVLDKFLNNAFAVE